MEVQNMNKNNHAGDSHEGYAGGRNGYAGGHSAGGNHAGGNHAGGGQQEVTNFARFYSLLHQLGSLPYTGEPEEMKRELVSRYTTGRTTSLREMRREEYAMMCRMMEGMLVNEMQRRKERSRVLNQMQRMGIDTTQWARVNAFCEDVRIAGKPFAHLTIAELCKLRVKLYMIERHGGLEQVTRQVGAEALEAMK